MYTIHTSNFPGFTGAGPRHQPTPVFLPEKSHGEKSLVGYSPWGHKELDMTQQLSMYPKIILKKKKKIQLCIISSLNILKFPLNL